LKDLIHHELETLPQRLEELDPRDRLELMVKLIPYAMPRVAPVAPNTDEPIEWP
jgi:hypothetical protein